MANLIIDQGNSGVKVAIFSNEEIVLNESVEQLTTVYIDSLFQRFSIGNGILSKVKDVDKELVACLVEKLTHLEILTEKSHLPIINCYETPQTLGPDRLAAVVGADNISPNSTFLVVDAGTAITYDLVTNGTYIGGNIAPGMQMRFRALNTFTAKLPICSEQDEVCLLGVNTRSAIASGVVNGVAFEIQGYFEKLKLQYQTLNLIMTGGDAAYLKERINSPAVVEPFLVLKGLNRILRYNV